ncbi:MAG TPA: hypothetical protein DDX39_12435 [Bacteroidales bacterium]|nr:MAG: hypothetical protein A2W98_11840 [Bacteroidetes bacterium GWF2_33_38]OFY76462.1 MAG: hypothetical protein A2265_06980 [Bacteroidetes bacterium RIFOXYA12_FULL_33_9]OFY85137.1 MAG: hypothetical protein A2236_12240 [Bacteroidetes bacterium RIFOXYA2_FULL_33_7]HBF89441.1 hypothetical protein [Bacteroidales bacterium]
MKNHDKISESAKEIRKIIERAIETHKITHEENEKILMLATEDGFIDPQEKVLLAELNQMIQDRVIKFVKTRE